MVPIDITINNAKRNPHREFKIDAEERKTRRPGADFDLDSDDDEAEINREPPMVSDDDIRQVLKKSRKHNDLIKSIQYISCTDQPFIMTGSTDKLVHLIDMNSNIVGTLKQGYKSLNNYQWGFKCTKYLKEHPDRMNRMEKILVEVRA